MEDLTKFWEGFSFAHPELLWLLPVPLLLHIAMLIARRRKTGAVLLSNASAFGGVRKSLRLRLRPLLPFLRIVAAMLLIVAVARPQKHFSEEIIESEGIDIVLAIDVSGSMQAEDLLPNRLEAAKAVAAQFIDARKGDRIGLVAFGGESFTQSPVTANHATVKAQLEGLQLGMLGGGTAIGDGLATSVDRLRTGGKSRVVILMTDGINNTEHVSPATALEIAKTYGVRVYTIGIGSNGTALQEMQTPFGIVRERVKVEIDEPQLQRIAGGTGGKYFRATDNASLEAIYADIDRLEKVKIESTKEEHTIELAAPLLLAALIALLLETLLRYTYLRSFSEQR